MQDINNDKIHVFLRNRRRPEPKVIDVVSTDLECGVDQENSHVTANDRSRFISDSADEIPSAADVVFSQSVNRVEDDGTQEVIIKGTYDTIDVDYESLDYEEAWCKLRQTAEGGGLTSAQIFVRIPIMVIIGFATGLTAFFIMVAIDLVSEIKYSLFANLFTETIFGDHNLRMGIALVLILLLNAIICFVAAFLGVTCPVSCGSGIPHIKAYLNGIIIPRLLEFKTLFHKVLGVICSVVGGLPVGKEGPMIHSGAIHGGIWSIGAYATDDGRCNWYSPFLKPFRNDLVRRDFVAGGAAAGVAAAFGAPLGGVLFAIEEGCSYIDMPVLMLVLLASCASYLTLDFCKAFYLNTGGELSGGGLINFGSFTAPSYTMREFVIFVAIGIFGALSGAVWNYLNARLTQLRMRYVQSRRKKIFEVILVSLIVSATAFFSMAIVEDCKFDDFESYRATEVQLNCPPGKIHAGAAIWFETPENCVKDLFHKPSFFYDGLELLIFTVIYFLTSCMTYGISISSGLFIPSLLIGAAWGRLVGLGLMRFFPNATWGEIGKFSLMGAAAQLSGIVRLSISLCVILIEATGGFTFAFPILIVVIIAEKIGNLFNHGIYHIHLNLGGVPMLDWHPPKNAHSVTARKIMSTPVTCFTMRTKATEVFRILRETTFNAFPIVDPPTEEEYARFVNGRRPETFGRLRGMILRNDILTMIRHNFFDTAPEYTQETWEKYRELYPRILKTHDVYLDLPHEVSDELYLDFRNIMNPAPQRVSASYDFKRTFVQFRTTGARHIVVLNDFSEVVGMISRKDMCRPTATGGFLHNGPLKAKTLVKRQI